MPDPEQWALETASVPSLFQCDFCDAKVLYVQLKKDLRGQFCRCTIISLSHPSARPFRTPKAWSDWQSLYLQEKGNPAPCSPKSLDPDAVPAAFHDWICSKLGLPPGLRFDMLRGIISGGQTLISLGPESAAFAIDEDDKSSNAKIAAVMEKMCENGVLFPERLIIAGRDPDYVWPKMPMLIRFAACRSAARNATPG